MQYREERREQSRWQQDWLSQSLAERGFIYFSWRMPGWQGRMQERILLVGKRVFESVLVKLILALYSYHHNSIALVGRFLAAYSCLDINSI